MSEPLLFHMLSKHHHEWSLSLVAVDPIGAAMLIDNVSDINDSNSHPLLKTLLHRDRSSRLHTNPLDMDMRLMEMWLDGNGKTCLQALRAKGALSVLHGYRRYFFYYLEQLFPCIFSFHKKRQHELILSLLKSICRMGLTINADTPSTYCIKLNYYQHINLVSFPFLDVLFGMFEMGFCGYSRHLRKMYKVLYK